MKRLELPSIERLNELFYYDEETGKLYNKKDRPRSPKDKEAGCIRKDKTTNYRYVGVDYNQYGAHVIIMKLKGINLKDNETIDHINRNGLDNRMSNLRIVSNSINSRNRGVHCNSKTGVSGVHYDNNIKKYIARINIEINKTKTLGRFETFEEAVKARKAAEQKAEGYII